MVMVVIPVQSWKALAPMYVTPVPMVTEVMLALATKSLAGILRTPLPMVTSHSAASP